MTILYKYCNFSIYSLESIRSGKVYFSSPKQLNDPFDCFPEVVKDSSKEELLELLTLYGIESKEFSNLE